MTWILRDRLGATERDASHQRMAEVLADAMSSDDDEHADVALQHESGWAISFYPSGLVIYENVETDASPRQMAGCTAEQALDLWKLLASGALESLEALPWQVN